MSKRSRERRVSMTSRMMGEVAFGRPAPFLAPWTPMQEAVAAEMTPERREAMVASIVSLAVQSDKPVSRQDAERVMAEHEAMERWRNSRYTVVVDRRGAPMYVHLSIKRNDRECPGAERWRDFQRIKNEIVGPEHEAVELYPAESRVVDTANQFHLWVALDPSYRFPFGFEEGLRVDAGEADGTGAVQRPFEED